MRGDGDFFQYRSNVKIHVQVHFTVASQFYVHINVELYIRDSIHLFGGEKQIFYFLWYVEIGEDYTTQSRSDFDWYNPHLYNY